MSNKTSDKNVANIEDDVNELKSIMYLRTESGFAYSQKNTLELQKSIRHILAEREQKDKRIKELEEELEKANRQLDLDYVDENFIPKQAVIDLIENETIDISGFECIAVEDLEKIIGG